MDPRWTWGWVNWLGTWCGVGGVGDRGQRSSSRQKFQDQVSRAMGKGLSSLRDYFPEVQKHIVFPELEHRLAVGSYCDVL